MTDETSPARAVFDPTPGDALEELAELWFSLGDRHRDMCSPRKDTGPRPKLKDASIR